MEHLAKPGNSQDSDSTDSFDQEKGTRFSRFLGNFWNKSNEKKGGKRKTKPVSTLQLFRYATKFERLLIVIGVLCATVEGVFLTSVNYLSGKVYNIYFKVKEPKGSDEFLHGVLFYATLHGSAAVVIFFTSYLNAFFFQYCSDKIVTRIRADFLQSVLRQDANFLDSKMSGAIANQLTSNVDRIRDGIGEKIGLFCRTLSMSIAALIINFSTDVYIALIMFPIYPLSAVCMSAIPKFTSKPTKLGLETVDEANGVAEECIMNAKTIASCNGQETMINKYRRYLEDARRPNVIVSFIYGGIEGFSFFILYLFYALGFWYGVVEYHAGNIADPGNVFIVLSTTMFSAYALGQLGPHFMTIVKARVAAAIVYETIDSVPPTSDDGLDPSAARCDIRFESVHFTYRSRAKPVLLGLSWEVREGESIALVGQSGCGKSTSIGLITKLYECSKGSITLDGVDISEYDTSKLRKIIGIVSQEPSLFNGTIRENIVMGRPEVDEKRVEECCRVANAHDFIMGLEKGYDTLLGVGGVSLSGGQKQRIAIARAIATNPRILLLDEATSALDTHSERIVQIALDEASKGRTTVVIAHRFSTIKNVDRIYVIEDGQAVESGSFDELIAQDGKFTQMAAKQSLDDNDEEGVDSDDKDSNSIVSSNEQQAQRMGSVSAVTKDDAATTTALLSGILQIISVDWRKFALIVAVSIFRSFETPILMFRMQFIYQCMDRSDYFVVLLWTLISEVGVGAWAWMMAIAARVVAVWVSEKILCIVRVQCFSSLLYRPSEYFDNTSNSPASCSIMLAQHPANASAPVDYRASILVENVATILMSCVYCFIISWPTGLAILCCIIAFIVIFQLLVRLIQKTSDALEKTDNSSELAVEIFEQVRTVQLLVVEKHFIDRFTTAQESGSKIRKRLSILRGGVHCVSQTFAYASACAAAVAAAFAGYHGIVSPTQLFIAETGTRWFGVCLILMSTSFNDLIASVNASKKLFSLIDEEQQDIRIGGKPDLSGALEVDDVSFAYPSRPHHPVATDLLLSASVGEAIALVGPSGSGKSTIVQLIERFYDPTKGTISIDGHDTASMAVHHLRSSVALVGQEPVLFRGTIYDNVALGVEGIAMEDVRNACKAANIAQFIESSPEGFETIVGEKGRSLSGGQKQRIAIARAIIRNPKIILLDEATSALDSESEQVVLAALRASSSGRTSVTIAHRLSTIQHAHRIFFIEGGRVQESGNHQQLMQLAGKYAALVRAQSA